MPRLTIAVIAALGFHILLLMTILPEHRIVEPKIKGSGHVTVSIVRRQEPVLEVIEEVAAKPEQVKQQEETIQQEVEVAQIPLPVKVVPPLKPEQVKDITVPVKKVAETAKKKKVARKIVPAEPIPEKIAESVPKNPQAESETDSSAVESLRQPEPLESVNRPPAYPSLARKRGWQGTVLLEVDVQSDGMVKNIQIKESSSYKLLDREALDAVRKWRFSPGLQSGAFIPMKVIVPIHFLLQDN